MDIQNIIFIITNNYNIEMNFLANKLDITYITVDNTKKK